MHKVFKPARKGDLLRAAYLYADGHVVVSFVHEVKGLDVRVPYVQIAESVDKLSAIGFTGRIEFARPAGLVAASNLPGDVGIGANGDGEIVVSSETCSDFVLGDGAEYAPETCGTFASHAIANTIDGAKVAIVFRSPAPAEAAPAEAAPAEAA